MKTLLLVLLGVMSCNSDQMMVHEIEKEVEVFVEVFVVPFVASIH